MCSSLASYMCMCVLCSAQVNSRAVKTKNRTQDLNSDIRRTMEEDGFEQEQQRKKGGGNLKTKIAGEMVKGMLK